MNQSATKRPTRIGIISDTHGLLRPEALAALQGVELIIHAGDVGGKAGSTGKPQILDELGDLAPVIAVRGNIDSEPWALKLPLTEVVEAGPAMIYVLHNVQELDLDPAAAGFQMVVSGHSHQPSRTEKGGVIYLNPGSAGPRRFKLPITLARLDLSVNPWGIEFVDLEGRIK